jgi:hypothetical protein
MPRPQQKLGVALASDGHIHRQLPSETETPENAGEDTTFIGAFGFRSQRGAGLPGGSMLGKTLGVILIQGLIFHLWMK